MMGGAGHLWLEDLAEKKTGELRVVQTQLLTSTRGGGGDGAEERSRDGRGGGAEDVWRC